MSSQTQKVQIATKFNYEALEFQQRTEIEEATAAIRERLRKVAQDIWEIGRMLSEVQSKLQRGQFDEWIKTEFDWSRRMAYKFISVYKRFDRRINLEEINIATSALYLLAAESTPKEIREEFIQKAQQGEKVTHQEVLKVVKEAKQKSTSTTKTEPLSEDNTEKTATVSLVEKPNPRQESISIIPQTPIEKPLPDLSISLKPTSQGNLISTRGWYRLDKKHHVFYGDTALPEFANYISYANLALAITTDDWAHDWLVEKAKTLVVFPESEFDRQKLTGLILMFSSPEDKIIFPWLPNAEIIAITHQLGRQVYAGDMDAEKCQAALNYTGLSLEAIRSQ